MDHNHLTYQINAIQNCIRAVRYELSSEAMEELKELEEKLTEERASL